MAFDIIRVDNTSNDSTLGIRLEFNNKRVISSTVTNAEKSISNLKTLLLTRLGERYMQPEFGTRISEAIFEPNTEELINVLNESITTAINKWLPDINIITIDVNTDNDDRARNIIRIRITFNLNIDQINRTMSVFVNENGIFEVAEE